MLSRDMLIYGIVHMQNAGTLNVELFKTCKCLNLQQFHSCHW